MKIKNNPLKNAPNHFDFKWETTEENQDLWNKKIHKSIGCNYNIKFIVETCYSCDGDNDTYLAFMDVIIYVKDFKAYYKGNYIRNYYVLGNFISSDSQVYENKLEFKLMESGEHNIIIIKPVIAIEKYSRKSVM